MIIKQSVQHIILVHKNKSRWLFQKEFSPPFLISVIKKYKRGSQSNQNNAVVGEALAIHIPLLLAHRETHSKFSVTSTVLMRSCLVIVNNFVKVIEVEIVCHFFHFLWWLLWVNSKKCIKKLCSNILVMFIKSNNSGKMWVRY